MAYLNSDQVAERLGVRRESLGGLIRRGVLKDHGVPKTEGARHRLKFDEHEINALAKTYYNPTNPKHVKRRDRQLAQQARQAIVAASQTPLPVDTASPAPATTPVYTAAKTAFVRIEDLLTELVFSLQSTPAPAAVGLSEVKAALAVIHEQLNAQAESLKQQAADIASLRQAFS